MNATHIVLKFGQLVKEFLNSSSVKQFKSETSEKEYKELLKRLINEVHENV